MLHLAGLSKTYANGVQALDSVSLDLAPGAITAVVGGSGCGKSTMLRLIAGLDRPSAGAVSLDGSPVDGPRPEIGIVFQEPRPLPWPSVADNAGFGLAHLPREEREGRVEDALARVGLAGYGRRWPRELSGGQAQRVAIARALAPEPGVVLLDEPFSALDAFTRAGLHEHLRALWARTRPIMVIVTHDIDEAIALGDQVVVMRPRPGRIATSVDVRLAHPRDPLSPAYESVKRRLLLALDRTMRGEPVPETGGVEAPGLWW